MNHAEIAKLISSNLDGITLTPANPPKTPKTFDERAFLFGGKSIFTVRSKKTGERITYKVSACKDNPELFFVGHLSGPDNNAHYAYLGVIDGGEFRLTKASKLGEGALCVKAFRFVLDHIDALPADLIEFYHEGRCARCARRLTVPESIKSGFGPECITKL